jgi:hypothetical protein
MDSYEVNERKRAASCIYCSPTVKQPANPCPPTRDWTTCFSYTMWCITYCPTSAPSTKPPLGNTVVCNYFDKSCICKYWNIIQTIPYGPNDYRSKTMQFNVTIVFILLFVLLHDIHHFHFRMFLDAFHE